MYILSMEIIKNCNLSCTYCYLGEKENDRMSFETAKKAIDLAIHETKKQYDNTLHVYFIGGEPLLVFEFIEKCIIYIEKCCESNGLKSMYSTTTNGTLLTSEIIDYFIKKNFYFKLSLDGNKEIHDKNRVYHDGSGSYEVIESKMQLIKRYELKTGNIVRAAQVIAGNTYLKLPESLEYIHNLGFQIIESTVNVYEKWNGKDISVLCDKIEESFNIYMKMKYAGSSIHWEFIEARLEAFCEVFGFYQCKAGLCSIFVNCKGDIYPCSEIDDAIKIGNVDIGLDVDKIRELVAITGSENEKCLQCREYRKCTTCDCIMTNYETSQSFFIPPEVSCLVSQKVYKLFRESFTEAQIGSLKNYYQERKF
jgi:Arylsulfatase regulator (Fe-S oxidoreductase)